MHSRVGGPNGSQLWFRHSTHRSPSLNFTCTNSFGSHRCPASIIKNISVGAEQQRADPYESPTKRPNELLNVERSPFSYANDKSAAQAGGRAGLHHPPLSRAGNKGLCLVVRGFHAMRRTAA